MVSPASENVEGEAETGSANQAKRAARPRISKEARDALAKAFDNANIGENQKFQHIINAEVNAIISSHGLSVGQAKRQFKNWRSIKFHHGGVVCTMNASEIKAVVESHLSTRDAKMFVKETLLGMIPGTSENENQPSSRKAMFDDFASSQDDGVDILESILSNDVLSSVFVKIVENFISIAVDSFAKTAASLPQSEFAFFRNRMEAIDKIFAPEFVVLAQQHVPAIKCCWRAVAVSIEDTLFRSWCSLQYQTDKLPVSIPDNGTDRTTRYSRPVVYYVAGWILSDMEKGGGLRSSVKESFEEFAEEHILSKAEADALKLPSGTTCCWAGCCVACLTCFCHY